MTKHLLVALVVVSASTVGGIGIGISSPEAPETTESPHRNTVILGLFDGFQDLLDGVQNFIEQIDNFLESIVDLLKTLQELFGGGEGEGGGD